MRNRTRFLPSFKTRTPCLSLEWSHGWVSMGFLADWKKATRKQCSTYYYIMSLLPSAHKKPSSYVFLEFFSFCLLKLYLYLCVPTLHVPWKLFFDVKQPQSSNMYIYCKVNEILSVLFFIFSPHIRKNRICF